MQPDCLPYSAIPHTSLLFTEYAGNSPAAGKYYPRSPRFGEWAGEEARSLRYDAGRRQRVADILERQNRAWGASQATLDGIARFRSGAAVVVTGQQVSLFGGPLFSLYKALTAIRLAVEATQAGSDCVPVFWLATEDHDLAEVNHAWLMGATGTLERMATAASGAENAPVGTVAFGPEIESTVEAAARLLGDSEATRVLRQSYHPGETLGSAFARLFSGLFRNSGIILLDASDAELHTLAAPVYRAAAVAAADLSRDLMLRGRNLETEGFHTQVKVTPESTLLFHVRDGSRFPVHRFGDGFEAGGEKIAPAELERRIGENPEAFSANVLLRPVVQDFLLPTLAYVGGPSEVAYFAQAAVVYEELLGRVTPVAPRFSATLLEPRIERLLERYQVTLADTFHGAAALREQMGKHSLPEGVDLAFDSAAAALSGAMEAVASSLAKLDPTLVEASGKARSKMSYQLERLRARAARGQLR
ncbi:MAG: bacillithiol biosynthesis cysteine-adding enzyme BshC, partial [Terriglobales bacterium]